MAHLEKQQHVMEQSVPSNNKQEIVLDPPGCDQAHHLKIGAGCQNATYWAPAPQKVCVDGSARERSSAQAIDTVLIPQHHTDTEHLVDIIIRDAAGLVFPSPLPQERKDPKVNKEGHGTGEQTVSIAQHLRCAE